MPVTKKTPVKKAAAAKQAKPEKAAPKVRVTILGLSATSVLKWMGVQEWSSDDARKAFAALGEGGELKGSTLSTGLSDGRSKKYRHGAAELTAAQVKQLEKARR